jgi:hypothetical protein
MRRVVLLTPFAPDVLTELDCQTNTVTVTLTSTMTGAPPVTNGFKGGYAPPPELLEIAVDSRRVNTAKSVGLMVLDQGQIYCSALLGATAFAADPALGLAVAPATLLLVARGQRGLECMVHDASHRAVHEAKRK